MPAGPRTPFSVVFCNAMIRVAAQLVPAAQRREWKQEWTAEIWHRWQFLLYAAEWNRHEALALVRNCLGAFPDAAWHFASQDVIQTRVREWARSPWVFLAVLTGSLLLAAITTSGLPATRDLLFSQPNQTSGRLLFLWLHPIVGGGDKGLAPDVAPDWRTHSRLLQSVASFNTNHASLSTPRRTFRPLVITTEPELFQVLRVQPALGDLRTPGIVLDHRTWSSLFHSDPKAIGSRVILDRTPYRVTAVLPSAFRFLSRQPSVYLVNKRMTDPRVMVVARAQPGVTEGKLLQELTRISADVSYYFFGSDLRLGFLDTEMFTPLRFFGVATLVSLLMILILSGVRWQRVQLALKPENRNATARRIFFFLAKTVLALALVFVAGLEWTRSESSILLGSRDPAAGPVLLWLYIVGTMGVSFWCLADQRARCRVCLRLLCFPVRIGCPGCLLLDWSGTELACTEGHGLLHVPHLAPSWDEESEHWVALDESWSGLFAHTK